MPDFSSAVRKQALYRGAMALGAVVLFVGYHTNIQQGGLALPEDSVVPILVSSGPVPEDIMGSGVVLAEKATSLSLPVDATLNDVKVEDGSYVKQGDVLAVFRSASLDDELTQARTDVSAAEIAQKEQMLQKKARELELDRDYHDAKQTWLLAKNQFDAFNSLKGKGAVSGLEIKKAQLDLDAAEEIMHLVDRQRGTLLSIEQERVAITYTKLSLAQQKLETLQAQHDALQLRAPIEGVVTGFTAKAGHHITLGTTILTVSDPNSLYVSAAMPQTSLGKIKLKDPVLVVVNGQRLTASVTDIQRSVSAGRSIMNVKVDDPTRIALNQSVAVIAESLSETEQIYAKLPEGHSLREGGGVYVSIGKGTYKRKQGETISFSIKPNQTIVFSSGVAKNDTILATVPHQADTEDLIVVTPRS